MTTIQDRITENFRKQFYDEFGFCKNQYLLRDSNQFILEDFKQFLLTSIKEVEEETRKEVVDMANNELNEVINEKTIKYPPKYGVRLPNRPLPMEEQMFMCSIVSWRKVIEKLSITNKEKQKCV